MQIGDVNVRGMGSEQVASVLRQSGAHVRLIVARAVSDTSASQVEHAPHAPLVPTHQLDEHLHELNEALLALETHDLYVSNWLNNYMLNIRVVFRIIRPMHVHFDQGKDLGG